MIYVGGLDLFVNEDIDYAAKLTEANVDTELHVIPACTTLLKLPLPKPNRAKFSGSVFTPSVKIC